MSGFSWIKAVDRDGADDELNAAYGEVCRTDGSVHNMYQVFASRPDLLILADRFYRELLHNPRRSLEDWLQELIATHTAILCGCAYARDNHGSNFVDLLGDRERGEAMMAAMDTDSTPDPDDARITAIAAYTEKLTLHPGDMVETDVVALREAGLDDAQIFEVNQIVANFCYWARMLNGLGVTAEGEIIGMYGDPV
ncbi:MAG: alkylhydroperoxidase [Rhodospirillaceae bacterium]|nr:alkylhydroperoxidase [Rhodospirillaceae bacterium]|tara:strand:+ start:2165 stop:2752 length:588 start_codon:yes stop_codon:yes gene_type:complete